MKLLFLCCFGVFFSSCTCNNSFSKKESDNRKAFVIDTVTQMHNAMLINKNGKDSLFSIEEPVMIVRVPATTKKVKWYSLNYNIDGTGLLDVRTDDDAVYNKIELPNSSAVAAYSILLAASYVRFDTVTHEITAYRYEMTAAKEKIYKTF